jgi:cation diffusion facilitator family transporter
MPSSAHHAHTTHCHHAHPAPPKVGVVLLALLGFNLGYALLEGWTSHHSHSLSILGDALHMASDALSLGISALAWYLAQKSQANNRPAPRWEQGAAWLNGLLLLGVALYMVVASLGRLQAPPVVQSPWLVPVALGGLLVNGLSVALLHPLQHTGQHTGQHAPTHAHPVAEDTQPTAQKLNLKGAYLHLWIDFAGSGVAVAAALGARFLGWYWLDAVLSLVLGLLFAPMSWRLVQDAWHLSKPTPPSPQKTPDAMD